MWVTPRTWTAGEVVTAAMMNQHVRDNMNILKTSIADDGTIRGPKQLLQRQTTVSSAGAVDLVTSTYGLLAATFMAVDGDAIIMESWYNVTGSTWAGRHKFGGVEIGLTTDLGFGAATLTVYMKTTLTRTGALAQRVFCEWREYNIGAGAGVTRQIPAKWPLNTVVPMTGTITIESTVNDGSSQLVENAFRLTWVPAP